MSDAMPAADVSVSQPESFRELRIAVSVFFGVVTVALVLLWVRSYGWQDGIFKMSPMGYSGANTFRGEIGLYIFRGKSDSASYWKVGPRPISKDVVFPILMSDGTPMPATLGFRFVSGGNATIAFVPIWFLLLITTPLAVARWFRLAYHFSLRTLLIATTLVAVVLGLGVWLVR